MSCWWESICLFWLSSHFSNFCFHFLSPHAAGCVALSLCIVSSSSSSFSISSSFFLLIQAPFWWTMGPWDHLPLLVPAGSHIDAHGSSHPGVCWIIALLCFIISLYLYFCKMWCLFTLTFSLLLLIILCDLPSTRSPSQRGGLGLTCRCLSPLSHLLDPHTLHYIYRYSVIASGTLWFSCSVRYMCNLLHVCLS